MHDTGHLDDAVRLAVTKLRDSDRSMRRMTASFLAGHSLGVSPFAELLIAVAGASAMPSANAWNVAEQAASSLGYPLLRLFFAENEDIEAGTARSANNIGLSLEALKLHSLAYQAYTRASEKGASVARVNAANLVYQQSVAAAGLALLDQHSGQFDAEGPDYPHETRARLEKVLADETRQLDALRDRATRTFAMLSEFVERTVIEGTDVSLTKDVCVEFEGKKVSLSTYRDVQTMIRCTPLSNVYVHDAGDAGGVFLIAFDSGGEPLAIWLSEDPSREPSWLQASVIDWKALLETFQRAGQTDDQSQSDELRAQAVPDSVGTANAAKVQAGT
jgi:hypothetical protein